MSASHMVQSVKDRPANAGAARVPVSSIPIYKLPEGSPTWLGISCSSYERNSSSREPHLKIPKCAATTCVQSLGPGKSDVVGSLALQSISDSRLWQGHHATESEHSLSPADLGSPASPKESSEVLDAAAALSVAECVERMAPTLPKSDLNAQGSNPGLLNYRQILYHLSFQGSPQMHL